ncbi:hypothetical protein KJ836_03845 [Patescibacteria group bacterium]|nr:hypothetical protein [Patescibacteria group bacterium]
MNVFYNLHNLITIKISQGKLNLADGYNHYLRHFQVAEEPLGVNYEVKEFSEFNLPKAHISNGSMLGFKEGICFSKEKYALVLEDKKITEYTTYANRATNLWLQMLFLRQGLSFVHCAGVEIGGKGIIFPAFGGAGKTMLISKLRELDNCKFFGDDYVIVGKDSKMYSYPSDFSIYPYHLKMFPELKSSIYSKYFLRHRIFGLFYYAKKVVNFIWKRLSRSGAPLFVGWNADYVKVPAIKLIGNDIGRQTNLTAAVFLSRYSGQEIIVEEMSLDEMVKSTDGILWLESQHALPYLSALAAFGVINLASVAFSQREVIKSCFAPLKRFRILIPDKLDHTSYINFMTRFVREKLA